MLPGAAWAASLVPSAEMAMPLHCCAVLVA